MATLVLTAVGSAIGGPIGGAIGAAIGQQVDNALFAPKGREGPRLKELEVQTSSYGTSVPAVFGAMRVAGTVIWATDLIERKSKSGGGKGKPSTTQFTYSVSMAVAISSRPVERIGRIWADGNLLRGVGGDFKVDTQFRFHSGHADQALDPLIGSAETAGQCPAYRGLSYAVFEDLQLAEYGNRIPSLTFEVFEREVPVALNSIFGVASSGVVSGVSQETVIGYAMSGSDVRAAISPLLDSFPVILRSKAGTLELIDQWLPTGVNPTVLPVADEAGKKFERPAITLDPVQSIPRELSVRHFEPERDFQAGLQSSGRGGVGRSRQQIELPAALDAVAAKRIAELALLEAHRSREALVVYSAIGVEALFAGQWLADSSGKVWRIIELEHFRGSTKISARASLPADPAVAMSATPGRNIGSPDLLAGQTELAIIDLPVFDTTDPGKSLVGIFANGTGSGWRRAALAIQHLDQLTDIGPTAAPAIIGRTMTALAPHNLHMLDTASKLDIQLVSAEIEFALPTGTPAICWVGGEFIRFGSLTALGSGQYRLTNLQRGCFGTDAAIGTHQTGDQFVLLEPQTARLVEEVPLVPGSTATIEAFGIGDEWPVTATTLVTGKAVAPLPPVHGFGRLSPDGGIDLQWIRRSRIDFGWNDGVDQAIGEDGEQYSVSLSAGNEIKKSWTTRQSALVLSATTATELFAAAGPALAFSVRQIGRYMPSAPVMIEVAAAT